MDPEDAGEADDVSTLLRAPQFDPTPITDAAFEVSVVEGPDRGRTLTLSSSSPNRVLVGTSPACDFVLTDREASRRHAALALDGRRLRLTDLGSTNGTTVNGLHVFDVLLAGGESVRLGATLLQIATRSQSAQPASLPMVA
jgi:pSer/pThr/pTyr-binding forkhead associated (FHA) protein